MQSYYTHNAIEIHTSSISNDDIVDDLEWPSATGNLLTTDDVKMAKRTEMVYGTKA